MDRPASPSSRGQSAVLGELLMVGVVVVVAAGIAAGAFLYAGTQPTIQAETVVEVQETSAGTTLEVQRIGQAAEVRIEGDPVATLNESDAGRSVYLPTAPGEEVTVVATEGDQSLLLSETIDRGEAGDFIAYYTFSEGTGSNVTDRSRNDNTARFVTQNGAAPSWDATAGAVTFDGDNDGYLQVDDVSVKNVSDVEAFTVAATFSIDEVRDGDGTNNIHQIVEHSFDGSGNEWYLETPTASRGGSPDDAPFKLEYAVNYPDKSVQTNESIGLDDTVTAVATYDGQTYELYLDGRLVASKSDYTSDVEMGDLTLARDDEQSIQYLDGSLYEFRLYYTAFDTAEVETLTERMDDD